MIPAPTSLSIDSGGDEFPVSESSPRLSWTPPPCASLMGYEVEAQVDDVARPPVSVASHLYLPWPWEPLMSTQRVAWRVRAEAGDGMGEWSPWHRFEVGLLNDDWTASWISPVEGSDPGYGRRPAHRLALDFHVSTGIVSARLYATALGVYESFVNGIRAGTARLSPGASSYDRTLYAQASDVTRAVREGGNRMDVFLSDGWYRGQVGAFRRPAEWGTTLAARAELHLWLADGSRRIVGTDRTWSSSASSIRRADLMDGQTTDLRGGAASPEPVRVDVVETPPVRWSPAPPIRVVETRPVRSVAEVREGVWVADFGQNASGWVRLSDLGPEGTRTVLEFAEHTSPDGDIDTSHLDATEFGHPAIAFVQRDEVVSAGDGRPFAPGHTVHGFRYVRISRDGGLDPQSVSMEIVHTDLRPTGEFACSDADLTRLWQVATWSFRGNAVDIPTDCPTRERLGWTGDYQIFASTAARMFDVSGFSRKWLTAVRDDQLPDGRIANFSPDGRAIKHHLEDRLAMMTGSAGWGDAIVHVPWELYRAYADPLILEENYAAMVAWVEWALSSAATQRHPSRVARSPDAQHHERYVWDGSFHWGEWGEPTTVTADGSPVDTVASNPMAWFSADKGEVGTAYLYRSTSTLARIAAICGRAADAQRFDVLAAHVRQAWRTEFLRPDGHTVADTQAAYVRALMFGLVPDDLRGASARRLVELVREAGDHPGTGFLSTADLLPILADTGHADCAFDVLFQRTPPSWLAMLDRGATTIWEDWNGIDDAGRAHESLNHYSKGAAVRFLHSHLLGLQQDDDATGWKRFTVRPVMDPRVTWASGSLETPRGTIRVAWVVAGTEVTITVDVPATTHARLIVPDGTTHHLVPGHHEVRGRTTTVTAGSPGGSGRSIRERPILGEVS